MPYDILMVCEEFSRLSINDVLNLKFLLTGKCTFENELSSNGCTFQSIPSIWNTNVHITMFYRNVLDRTISNFNQHDKKSEHFISGNKIKQGFMNVANIHNTYIRVFRDVKVLKYVFDANEDITNKILKANHLDIIPEANDEVSLENVHVDGIHLDMCKYIRQHFVDQGCQNADQLIALQCNIGFDIPTKAVLVNMTNEVLREIEYFKRYGLDVSDQEHTRFVSVLDTEVIKSDSNIGTEIDLIFQNEKDKCVFSSPLPLPPPPNDNGFLLVVIGDIAA